MPTTSDQPICIDLTRLVSRVGRGPWTGIDRVEHAWLVGLCKRSNPLFGLVRLAGGYAVLERDGVVALRDRLEGRIPWGARDLLSFAARKLSPARQAAEADIRRLAVGVSLRPGLSRLLSRHLPHGVLLLNLGHSNLTPRVVAAVREIPGARFVVFLHDAIPLEVPQFHRPETVTEFRAKLRIAALADVIVTNSRASAADLAVHLAGFGDPPAIIVAWLGAVPPEQGTISRQDRPYFLSVGTISQRKNQGYLIDLWAEPDADLPDLVLAGPTSWDSAAALRRLEGDPKLASRIQILEACDDATMTGLIRGAQAVLVPSHAEGFGLVAVQAALCGIPCICTPLPAIREVMGDIPVYARLDAPYHWRKAIDALSHRPVGPDARILKMVRSRGWPDWDGHLNLVLSAIG